MNMDFYRRHACMVLGVTENASEEEIKTAYKQLVKQYHPDNGNNTNPEYYHNIVQAYQYLKANPLPSAAGVNIYGQGMYYYGNTVYPGNVFNNASQSAPYQAKIIGKPSNVSKSQYSRAEDYAKFQKKCEKQVEERKEEFEHKVQVAKEKQEEYERTMEAINAIRVAEAIKAIIRAREK